MQIEDRLKELGHELPEAPSAYASYVPYTVNGNTVYIAGQIPYLNGQAMHHGRLGEDLSIEDGVKAAEACALNILAQAQAAAGGDWTKLGRCLKLGGFVNCTPDFTDHPKVVNGASELIVAVMGDAGRHARFAVGAPSLPLGVAVEIDAVFEIKA